MSLGLLLSIVMLASGPVAGAPVIDSVPTESLPAAIDRDAAAVALATGEPVEAARLALRAQVGSVAATDAIAREFAGRLVGIAFDPLPAPTVTILLTGDDPVAPRIIDAGGIPVAVTFRTGAKATHSELVAAITAHQAAVRASLIVAPGMGIDSRTGEVVIMVGDADARAGLTALHDRFAAELAVPVRIDRSGSPMNMMIPGGARVVGVDPASGVRYACTTGFAVTDGTRTGIATAAHCPDTLSVAAVDRSVVPLTYVGQWGWGYQDVQINASDAPLAPYFYADTAKTIARPVADVTPRASTRVGDVVCHRGERTGYSCARVLMVDFAPAGDLCGGACLPTWVAVAGPTCRAGDSGAPVFVGTSALGIVKGGSYRPDGSCALWFYMSVDYMPAGWRVMTTGDPAMPLPAMPATPAAIAPAAR